jgi:hypothetical protein
MGFHGGLGCVSARTFHIRIGKYTKEPTTLIVFALEEMPGGVLLTITASGFDNVPLERRAKAFAANDGGWAKQTQLIETKGRDAAGDISAMANPDPSGYPGDIGERQLQTKPTAGIRLGTREVVDDDEARSDLLPIAEACNGSATRELRLHIAS